MRVGQLSQKTGVSVRMLRYYEQQGLLKPGRSQAGYRDYDENPLLSG
jgi:DNA-binding transcriptional MerR regulator